MTTHLENEDIFWGIGIEHECLLFQTDNSLVKGHTILDNLDPNTQFDLKPYIDRLIDIYSSYSIHKPIYIAQEDLENYIKTQAISSYLETLLGDYQKLYPSDESYHQLLLRLIDEIHQDGTCYFKADEFVTHHWQNQPIRQSVKEIILLQSIIQQLISEITQQPTQLALLGSAFPLVKSDVYFIDYTGSYHLNLSLPYSLSLLQEQEYDYEGRYQEILDLFKGYIANQGDTYTQQLKFYLDTPNLIEILAKEIREVYPKGIEKNPQMLENALLRYREIRTRYNHPHFRHFLDHSEAVLKNTVFLFKLTTKRLTKDNLYVFYLDNGKLQYITRLKPRDFKQNQRHSMKTFYTMVVDTFGHLIEEGDTGGIVFRSSPLEVYRVNSTTERKMRSHIQYNSLDFKPLPNTYIESVKDIFQKLDKTVINDLSGICYNKIADLFRDSVLTPWIQPLNQMYNSNLKYQYPYHRLHHRWAIAIQWVLPLLLSCFSSCDPLSVIGNPKLSQLSLRLFISGYSFINFVNVMEHHLPQSRDLEFWEYTPSHLLPSLTDQFAYTPRQHSLNTEFRVDPEKGFGFGFELRIFDNFASEHLTTLLEFLFLLADHLETQQIELSQNPFNHPVLQDITLAILHRGWHTTIPSNYIELLQNQLKLPLSYNRTAYQTCDDIYLYLQNRYLKKGKGVGPFGQYVIQRPHRLRHLPNINRESWYQHFLDLVWKPNNPPTRWRTLLEKALVRGDDLDRVWGPQTPNVLPDIEYALYTLDIEKKEGVSL